MDMRKKGKCAGCADCTCHQRSENTLYSIRRPENTARRVDGMGPADLEAVGRGMVRDQFYKVKNRPLSPEEQRRYIRTIMLFCGMVV